MSKRSTAIGRRFQAEKRALAVISEYDDILLSLRDVVRARFHTNEELQRR
jgi:hypothetical protein